MTNPCGGSRRDAGSCYRPPERVGAGRGTGGRTIYACICFGVNERTAREHIRDGAVTLERLAEACGAGSDCGECKERLQRLIAEERNASSPGTGA